MLAGMTIAVVGASGTGSLVCELLARAGCRRIILIDHDIVRVINLNRVLYARPEDALRGVPKVEVLRRGIEALGLGCRIEPVQGSILDADVLRRVLDSDLVFGCVDRALPRHLLCELAARYMLPYIDVGSEIGGDEDGIVSLDSRVSYMAPGRPCLTCTGVVTPRRLRFESLTEGERQREVAMGYSEDLVLTQPAVMDVNMRAASGGVLVLRHLLQPFLKEPLPIEIHENSVTYCTIPASAAKSADPACPTCQKNPRAGHGDRGPKIGFDAETASRLLGSDSIDTTAPRHWLFHKTSRVRMPHFLRRANEVVSAMMRRGRR
jgi:NAD(P)-dependent dehydrogenase (short-subunit alcohol dehydrogenase family)